MRMIFNSTNISQSSVPSTLPSPTQLKNNINPPRLKFTKSLSKRVTRLYASPLIKHISDPDATGCPLMKLRTDTATVELSPERQGEPTIPLTPDSSMSASFSSRFTRKRSVDTASPVRIEDVEYPMLLPDVKKIYQPALHFMGPAFCRDQITNSPEIIENGDCKINSAEAFNQAENLKSENYWNCVFLKQQKIYEQMLAGANAATITANLQNVALAVKLAEQEIERKNLEKQLAKTTEEFSQLKSIMANTAHDFKSPLNTLILGVESIRSDVEYAARHEEILDCLESACAFMHSSIGRCIDFSKSDNGVGLSPSNSPFDLLSSLRNPVKWVQTVLPLNGSKSITLDPIPPNVGKIISDKHWFEENLLCLLSNAEKYSSKGVIRVKVSIKNKRIRVSVEDSGIGVSASSKLLLFKQFSKLDSMTVGSTGLGLFSMLKRTEALGGSCGVEDRGDKCQGSVFWFEIPYAPYEESEDVLLNSSPSSRSLNILVVDDSACIVKCMTNKLKSCGHSVISACNGAEAVDKMVEMRDNLDLVFMDVQMPVMDGIEATKRYRQIELDTKSKKRLPIICSSANCGGQAGALAMKAGMDLFLSKPFTVDELSAAIAGVDIGTEN